MTGAEEKNGVGAAVFPPGFRRAGILIHVSSLPSPYGIGRIGRPAREFVDFLAAAGIGCWQFLPLGPVEEGHGFSPYTSISSLAGNPLFIDPDCLVEEGLLGRRSIVPASVFSPYSVDYAAVSAWNDAILRDAYRGFSGPQPEFDAFCRRQADWLDDFCLFAALKKKFHGLPWYRWPGGLAHRDSAAVCAARDELRGEVRFQAFCQFLFFRQWERLRAHAAERGVLLFGDMPFYVALDSVDVWRGGRELFLLAPDGRPAVVAGVPPDYFSATGQLWGNPVYRWSVDGKGLNPVLLGWWEKRLATGACMADLCRIDHFRGFAASWQVPAGAETAAAGQWRPGPGAAFFREMMDRLGRLPFVAEDLGQITPDVRDLLDGTGLPGMKVLQFAFDFDPANPHLPHNYQDRNCVVYTGTHDNDTTVGWFLSSRCGEEGRRLVRRYCNSNGERIHEDMIRLAFGSVAALAVAPMQDFLGYGSDCRMNVPGTARGNWRWRLVDGILDEDAAAWIRETAGFYNRLPGR